MNGASVKKSVQAVCDQLDGLLDPRMVKRAVVIAAIPAVSLGTACVMYGASPAYGGPFEEYDCSDGYDDDGDGLIDCEDPDCSTEDESCLGCDDGQDNDGDGLADCDDPDCSSEPECGF